MKYKQQNLYKSKQTLYTNDFDDYLDTDKFDESDKLFARKGALFTIVPLTKDLRQEYDQNDERYKYIAISNDKSKWVFFEERKYFASLFERVA